MFGAIKGPFLKVLDTAATQKKADKIVAKLKKQGIDPLFTLHNQKDGTFQIGVFDESRLDEFDRLDNSDMYKKVNCDACNTPVSENRFFKCVNCGKWECLECGKERLYGGQVPLIHNCGHDHFEFLADIGKCRFCRQPLGFRSAPQSLRMRMIAKIVPTGQAMLVFGMIAAFGAEEVFIENEVGHIYKLNLKKIIEIRSQPFNYAEWLQVLEAIKSNYQRMSWSCNYVVDVLGMFLGLLNKGKANISSQKMKALKPYLNMMAQLTSTLTSSLGQKSFDETKFHAEIDTIIAQLSPNVGKGIDVVFMEALKRIREFPTFADFQELRDHINLLLLPEQIIKIIQRYPPTLDC